jgi:hypothetical protein
MTPLVNLEETVPDGFAPRREASDAAGTCRPRERS